MALLAATIVFSAERPATAGGHGAPAAHEEDPEADVAIDATIRGIELGEFRIRSYYPVQAQKTVVRFALYAAVPKERYAEVQQVVERNLHRLRDQVITATRLAPLAMYDDPGLATFRRLILVRLRRALPELELDQLFVSDFQLTAQNL